jgi:NodT family efflux transporter outer membrane factor (OMF) lipoprotein
MRNQANLQASGRLELDFFGRHAAALRAALGQQQAAAAELQAARVLLTANLARGWVALARLFSLRQVAERTLAQRQAQLALTRQRVSAGLDTEVELRLAQGSVPEAAQQIEALDGQITLARHQLAALAGLAPQALDGALPRLAALRSTPLPERIGADLLGRRADVVAARWRVEAAAAGVDGARADFYPDINLVAFAGFSTLGLDRLLSLGSRNYGAGPALRLPLFDGGVLRARLGARSAEADAAVAAYNGAVLDAAREVADAGATLRSLARQRAQQAQAGDAAEAAHGLARQRYEAGLGSYLLVLGAESAVLAQRNSAAELQARVLDTQVSLMRALGGGWRDERPSQAAR